MICYHHNNLDGRCAAAIVLRRYPECRMREIDYKDNPDFSNEIKAGETVFIVDFSFKPEKMKELLAHKRGFIHWIDHHKTAKDYGYDLMGLRDFSKPGKSGCELTWEYLFPNNPMPEAVRLIGAYDTWRFDTEKYTKLFQEGMKLEDTNPLNSIWELLQNSWDSTKRVEAIRTNGLIATKYRDNFVPIIGSPLAGH